MFRDFFVLVVERSWDPSSPIDTVPSTEMVPASRSTPLPSQGKHLAASSTRFGRHP